MCHRFLSVLSALLLGPFPAPAAESLPPPNIILILTDDQGYGDLACHGNPIVKTPHLDRLYRESVRFTDFQVSPTCAPTRAALLSGRHEFHGGVTHTINERERLNLHRTVYPQLLRAAGYATGIFGKWHLGDEPPYQPDRRGFDEVFIHGAGGIGQTYPGSCGDAPGNRYFNPAILHNRIFEKTEGYCTDIFFDRAWRWIAGRKGKGPFYAHIATNAPHAPLDCPEKYQKMYEGKVDARTAAFFGMITNIDDNVGRLLANLKEAGLERDTLVIFMTDNGGTAGVRVHNAGMRGQKGTPYLGGTRVPAFFRWPGTFRPGDVDRLTAHIDLFPTLVELTGARRPGDVVLDGRSLVPLLRDPSAPWEDRTLITHVGRWDRGKAREAKYHQCSVRNTRFHLVNATRTAPKWELFDVKNDPGEKTDVSAKHPEVVKGLEATYDRWWDAVLPDLVNEDAVGPKVNPFKELYERQFGAASPPSR
jgi:arylsulfatase